jgi:hypothetical protein
MFSVAENFFPAGRQKLKNRVSLAEQPPHSGPVKIGFRRQ